MIQAIPNGLHGMAIYKDDDGIDHTAIVTETPAVLEPEALAKIIELVDDGGAVNLHVAFDLESGTISIPTHTRPYDPTGTLTRHWRMWPSAR